MCDDWRRRADGAVVTSIALSLGVGLPARITLPGQTSAGEIEWLRRPHYLLSGRVVVVVDDVLDEGLTLSAILKACKRDGAAEALTAVLVAKRLERCAGMPSPNFVGLETDERYLFGYGMDYKNYLRNAPGIFAVNT